MTDDCGDDHNATMAFGRKRKEHPTQQSAPPASPSPPHLGSPTKATAGTSRELPYYDKGKRKIIVYTSDPSGKIIKTFKK